MTTATIHVVVAFTAAGDDVIAEPPQQAPTASAAVSRAKALAARHVGVIAWSRTADPTTGDYGDPVELARLGTIPEWFDESGDAGG